MKPNEDETSIDDPKQGPNTGQLVKGDLQMSGATDPIPNTGKDQILGSNDNDEQPIVPAEGDPRDVKLKKPITFNEEDDKQDDEEEIGEAIKGPEEKRVLGKDIIEGEDPFTSGTGPDQTPELNQVRKPQAQLDDTPLQEEPHNFDAEMTNVEEPREMANDENPDDPNKFEDPEVDPEYNNLGDSGQVRLKLEQEGEDQNPDRLPTTDGIMDKTGMNMEPDAMRGQYEDVTEEDYLKKTQDGSNVLEQEGDPLEDGAIIKPEDVQQVTPTGTGIGDPTLEDPTLLDTGATGNDPSLSGIDEEEVDPNILHTDPEEPESGVLYTDNTDEQGNEIPDLRFDQTPNSDEQQPEIENEYEIVTKEEYEQHVDSEFGNQDQFDAELDDPSMDMLETPQEEFTPEEVMDPVETDEEGNPVEMTDVDGNPLEEESSEAPIESQGEPDSDSKDKSQDGSDSDSKDEAPKESSSEPKESSDKEEKDPNDFSDEPEEEDVEQPKEETPKKKSKPKETKSKEDDSEEPSKKTSTPEKKKDPEKTDEDKEDEHQEDDKESTNDNDEEGNINDSKGGVEEILDRRSQLIEDGVPEEEIDDILKDEFKDDTVEDVEDIVDDKNK